MQFELSFGPPRRSRPLAQREDWLRVGSRQVKLLLVPNRRARRYVLRLRPDGAARVAIPRGGSATEARRFAERNSAWLEKQLLRQATLRAGPRPWTVGTEILFRGERVRLEAAADDPFGSVCLGSERIRVKDPSGDLRLEMEWHLWRLAAREFSARVIELSEQHLVRIQRVSVRNQRSRWGSCSRRGTISLNWRLIQAPEFVRDYIILHELAHVKEMNHSRRFWAEVARLCPEFTRAEIWIKQNAALLNR